MNIDPIFSTDFLLDLKLIKVKIVLTLIFDFYSIISTHSCNLYSIEDFNLH